jgi:two-component system, NarL family, sensor kinase
MRLLAVVIIFFFIKHSCAANEKAIDTVRMERYLDKAEKFIKSNPDSSLIYITKAEKLSNGRLTGRFLSKADHTLGFYYINSEDFSKATKCFLEALAIDEERKDYKHFAKSNDNLGWIYFIFEKFSKSMDYYKQALDVYTQIGDTIGIAKVNTHIGILYMSKEYCENRTDAQKRTDYLTAIPYYNLALTLYQKIGNKDGIINVYNNLGVVYNKLNEPHKTIEYLKPVEEYYVQTNNIEGLSNVNRALGRAYLTLKQYEKSLAYYNQSIDLSKKNNLTGGIQFLYEDLAYAYEVSGDYKNAKNYYVKYMILRDSIYNSEKTKQIFELETKFQTEKKEKEILVLTMTKKKKNFFIYSLILICVLFLVTGLYFLNRMRSKRIIAEHENLLKAQKIKELESERQLIATQSVLRGEETERERLARDLHDGLGGLLSGVKLSLTHLKGTYLLPQENVIKFDRTLELLDSSISEMRRISHNMMPEALVKFGLKDALNDFINRMDRQKGIHFSFQFFGKEERVERSLETVTYRIAMELVNNAIKHAQAKSILVQLVQDEKRIHLTVQDDGIGFDVHAIELTNSSGMKNLKARVASFKGKLDMFSEPGKGAEISIEFSL